MARKCGCGYSRSDNLAWLFLTGIDAVKILWALALITFSWSFQTSAKAETLREMPSCYDGFGDIWGEDLADIGRREIDGSMITDIAVFSRITGTRELFLKVIKGGNFSGWNFTKVPLHQICFEGSDLKGADFSGAEGTGAGFIKSDLTGANMQGAVMPRVMFRNANLSNVTAQNANFNGGHFDGGWFEGGVAGWNLDGATMTEFQFECGITVPDGCPVYQGGDPISARGADFTRATLHSFGLYNVELGDAILDDTIVGPKQLPKLHGAQINGGITLRGGAKDIAITAEETAQLIAANAEWNAKAAGPSFNCAKASNIVERYICGKYGQSLRLADLQIKLLYDHARLVDRSIKASQRAWLKNGNKCADKSLHSCITDSYALRKGDLLAILGEQKWLNPGEAALFVDQVLPVARKFQAGNLYQKIEPVLAEASSSEILVERSKDGLYSIKGMTVGANAHLCSLDASHLYFDKKSGWYVPVSEAAVMPIFRIFEGRLEVFENGRPDYKKYPEGGNYMSCGMRASFGETIRINVDDDALAAIRKSFAETM